MKVGAENRNKLIASVSLMALALLLVLRMVFAFSTGASSPKASSLPASVAPIAAPTAAPRSGAKKTKIPSVRSLDPSLRFDLLKGTESIEYTGTGRNVFQAQADIPKPVAPAELAQQLAPPGPPQPAPPPPINLKFFGFASKPGETKKIFLSQGEDVFIAAEGDIIDRRYKILRIMPSSVEVEDVLNNNRQSIPLVQS